MIPVAQTLKKHQPDTDLTWIVGKREYELVRGIEGIEFVPFDKSKLLGSYCSVARTLRRRKFDVLLCAQVSLRANMLSSLIRADLKLGYDPTRAKDMHSLFIDESIKPTPKQHVLDSFFSFIEHIGVSQRELVWNYFIPDEAQGFAKRTLDEKCSKVVICPCSSKENRNWRPDRYAAVADYAIRKLNAQVMLCGGGSESEIGMGRMIEEQMQEQALNLIGQISIKGFLALLQRSDVLISPDSGPAHMAAGLGMPVVGLYAVSNPERSGPYFSRDWCVNKYAEAAQAYQQKSAEELKWGTKIVAEGVMNLIQVSDVTEKLNALLAGR